MKWFASTILLLMFLTGTADAQAAETGFLTCSGLDCNLCDAIEIINAIVQWVIGIAVLLAICLMAVAGFRLVTSGGDRSAYEGAKKLLYNSLIGFIIILAAWTIIDTLLKVLATDETQEVVFGVWNEIECGGMTNQATGMPDAIDLDDTVIPPNFYPEDGEPNDGWNGGQYVDAGFRVILCDTEAAASMGGCDRWCESVYPTSVFRTGSQLGPEYGDRPYCVIPPAITCMGRLVNGVCQPIPPDPGADGVFDFQPGISAQMGHASPALAALLSCMAARVPANVGEISSISDSLIVNGSQTFHTCAATGMCAHARNSYHYGGAVCTGQSYAVDFGDEHNVSILCTAARGCNTSVRDCSVHNGNHVHIDIPLSCGG